MSLKHITPSTGLQFVLSTYLINTGILEYKHRGFLAIKKPQPGLQYTLKIFNEHVELGIEKEMILDPQNTYLMIMWNLKYRQIIQDHVTPSNWIIIF